MKILRCKTNHVRNPLGFAFDNPVFSWTVEETEGTKQKWARILVSEDAVFSTILFDSGEDGNASSVAYRPNLTCKPYTRYYWTVEVAADNGERAKSEVNWFETAKQKEPWDAQWISAPKEIKNNPVFTRSFYLEKNVKQARIYLTGLGLYELFVNGVRVGEEHLSPGVTEYKEWIQYQTYELDLKQGENTIEISLGNGWYKGRFSFHGNKENYGSDYRCIAEIRDKR